MTGSPAAPRRRRLADRARRGVRPALGIAKTTLAAVLSYVAADAIGTSNAPVLAPLTAILVVQVTMYRTVTESVQRVASVVSGVLLAVAVARVVGLSWWSLGAVVAASLVLGRLLRLGSQIAEVPISAMLVLAVGGAQSFATSRVYETLIGAGVGVLTNVVLVPPLYLEPAGQALGDLASRLADFLRSQAAALRRHWSRADADHWLNEARRLGNEVAHADRVLAHAEESALLNPRSGPTRREQPRLRAALTGLDRCHLSMRELCRALLDRTYFVPVEEEETGAYAESVRNALGDVLVTAADAVEAVGEMASTRPGSDVDAGRVEVYLDELRQRRDQLGELLLVDPATDPAAWEQHGALLAAVDRLRVEVEAAAHRPDQTWHPPLLTDWQRDALHRLRTEGWQRRGRRHRRGRRSRERDARQ